MTTTKISSADYTDMFNLPSSTDIGKSTFQWEIEEESTDAATGEKEYAWTLNGWGRYLAYYKKLGIVKAKIDKKALWTVGQGFKINGNVLTRLINQRKLGIGKDTLTTILYNLDRVGQIAGDCFAEIIKDKSKRIINLKPLSPDSIRIIANEYGRIKRYEQISKIKGKEKRFETDQIFHISFSRIADEVHGISEIEGIEKGILMKEEAKTDIKTVFHRYVKPLLITQVDSDDTTRIAEFKTKLDRAVEFGENIIIPAGTVSMERMSIPQYSTLDPLPWVTKMEKEEMKALGVPSVILGASSPEDTEASSKIVYLAYEQLIKYRQRLWEENIKNQLGLKIKFNFSGSIEPSLIRDANKDGNKGGVMGPDKINPAKHTQ